MKILLGLLLLAITTLANDFAMSHYLKQVEGKTEMFKINKINTEINHYKYKKDKFLYGFKDHWATANEFFDNKGGDCEDFAITKGTLLKKAGVTKLYVHIFYTKRGHKHATLIVKTKKGDFYELDNNLIYPKKIIISKIPGNILPFNEVLRLKYS